MSESSSQVGQTRAEKLVSFLIASVAVLAGFITYMQTYSAGKGAEADRLSSQFAVQAMQVRTTGQTRVSHERQGAYQTWYELDLQALGAELAGDDAAAARYRSVRDHITALSPIFGGAYYDPASGYGPNVSKYEADLYVVDSTRLTEKFTAYNKLSNAWSDRAKSFIVHLTLLAVSLSLFGLSTTMRGFMRGVFIALGIVNAGVVVLWALIVMVMPLPSMSEAAIESYANGVGKAWYGDSDGAIADFDQALALEPGYANALYERGNAYYSQGDFQSALANYEAAAQAGRDDTSVGWNLGWTYYLVGRFDEAIATDRAVLAKDPSLIGVQFNLALALLANGDLAEAETEYYRGVNQAVDEVARARAGNLAPPSSFWHSMDAAAQDLESLLLELDGNARWWSQAPNRGAITADQAQIRDLASRMFQALRDTTTALEFTGGAPVPPGAAITISPFEFALEKYDSDGKFLNYEKATSFAYRTNSITVMFDYSGLTPGQSELWKVYHNGREDPTLRVINAWGLKDSGSAVKLISYAYSNLFIFAPGEYTVELYIDSHLVQRGTFIVEESK